MAVRRCRKHRKDRWTDLFTIRPAWNQQKHSTDYSELNIHRSSVQRIVKYDLCRQCSVPAQVISDTILNAAEKNSTSVNDSYIKRRFSLTRKLLSQPSVNKFLGCRKKRKVDENRLLVQRAKLPPHVIVLAGACFNGKGRLYQTRHGQGERQTLHVHFRVKVKCNSKWKFCYWLMLTFRLRLQPSSERSV